jgi:hypothetical protein
MDPDNRKLTHLATFIDSFRRHDASRLFYSFRASNEQHLSTLLTKVKSPHGCLATELMLSNIVIQFEKETEKKIVKAGQRDGSERRRGTSSF